MDKVQIIDSSNTAPWSKTFRDEVDLCNGDALCDLWDRAGNEFVNII
jgi:hypothetical protein